MISNIESEVTSVNVPEEQPGVRWEPKGGEIVVESFMPDDWNGYHSSEVVKSVDPDLSQAAQEEGARVADRMLSWALEDARTASLVDGAPSFPDLADSNFQRRFFSELMESAQ
jgi:hypothetical protein